MVDLTEMCFVVVWQVRARHKVQMFCARTRNQVLQAANAHLHAVAVALLQHGKQIEHLFELWITHVLLADQQADCGSARETPIFANKLQFCFDVVDQQRHVAIQIEIGHFEYQWIAQYGHAAYAIHLSKRR